MPSGDLNQHHFGKFRRQMIDEGAGADHLKALARVARLLRDQDIARKLRESRDAEALFAVLALNPPAAA